jgi:hypothetical protein
MVVCYFSAGSAEDWRDDFSRFEEADLGLELDEWEGERWLDVTSENVLEIMLERLDLAVSRGCDGVEADNMDGFANNSGFELTAAHQPGYNRRIANEAHDRGLSVLLKNDGDQAETLVDYFDGSLNEDCHAYYECEQLAPFTDGGKPIFNAEYADSEPEAAARVPELCAAAAAANTRTLLLPAREAASAPTPGWKRLVYGEAELCACHRCCRPTHRAPTKRQRVSIRV